MLRLWLSSLLLASTVVHGLNDWSKPCLQGECSYDLPTGNGRASGSLKIWGSPDAISDITTAAGWVIMGCDSKAIAQNIRLVCQTDDESSTCSHLMRRSAIGKIVRLPENCGGSPFARVARFWVHEDQSIPQDIANRLVRRSGVQPRVRGLALDTNFAQVDPAQTGNVSIAIQGATIPGQNGNLTITDSAAPSRRSRPSRRGLWKFIEDAFNKFNSFDKDISKSLTPVDVNKDFPLFDESFSCGSFQASARADINAQAHAVVTVGVAAVGTIIPPKLDEFGLYAALDANLDGSLTLTGSAFGSFDSGTQTIYQVAIPGLDFPGILSIGPTFKVLGHANANLDIGVNAVVDLSYEINGAKLFWPASNNPSGGGFTPGDTPLRLSVTASASSRGLVEAHLTPIIDFGVNALGGIAKATVSLNLDASAQLSLSLDANAQAGTTIPRESIPALPGKLSSTEISVGDSVTPSITTDSVAVAGAAVNGCIDIGAALNVNAGADASFFGIFDKSTTVSLFSKDWELFQKCFGASTGSARRNLDTSYGFSRRLVALERRSLSCPATNPSSGLTSIVNTVVTGLA